MIDITHIMSMKDFRRFHFLLGDPECYLNKCFETKLGRYINRFGKNLYDDWYICGDGWRIAYNFSSRVREFPHIEVTEVENLENFQYDLALLKISGEFIPSA